MLNSIRPHKLAYNDIRSIEMQEIEDYSKVMGEVKKLLNFTSRPQEQKIAIYVQPADFQEFHQKIDQFNLKIPKLESMKNNKIKEEYERKRREQLLNKKQKQLQKLRESHKQQVQEVGGQTMKSFVRLRTRSLHDQSHVYKDSLNTSQQEAFRAKVNLKNQIKYNNKELETSFQRENMISMISGQPTEPYRPLSRYNQRGVYLHKEQLKRKLSYEQTHQPLDAKLQEYFDMFDGPPVDLKRKGTRVGYKQQSGHVQIQRYESILSKVEGQQSQLIDECKNCKRQMDDKFIKLIGTIHRDRPLSQSMRRHSYTLSGKNQNINSQRRTADGLRKCFLARNQDQREWYQQLLDTAVQSKEQCEDEMCEYIFERLRNLLEDGQIIKCDDIVDLVNQLGDAKVPSASQFGLEILKQVMNNFQLDPSALNSYSKYQLNNAIVQ